VGRLFERGRGCCVLREGGGSGCVPSGAPVSGNGAVSGFQKFSKCLKPAAFGG
jgi:hypothetical protein